MGETRNPYNIFVGRPEGKRELSIPRRRWEDGIRMDLKEIVQEVVDWIYLAQDKEWVRGLVNTVVNMIKSSRAISRVRCT
jgi:hypothetical protein